MVRCGTGWLAGNLRAHGEAKRAATTAEAPDQAIYLPGVLLATCADADLPLGSYCDVTCVLHSASA